MCSSGRVHRFLDSVHLKKVHECVCENLWLLQCSSEVWGYGVASEPYDALWFKRCLDVCAEKCWTSFLLLRPVNLTQPQRLVKKKNNKKQTGENEAFFW